MNRRTFLATLAAAPVAAQAAVEAGTVTLTAVDPAVIPPIIVVGEVAPVTGIVIRAVDPWPTGWSEAMQYALLHGYRP